MRAVHPLLLYAWREWCADRGIDETIAEEFVAAFEERRPLRSELAVIAEEDLGISRSTWSAIAALPRLRRDGAGPAPRRLGRRRGRRPGRQGPWSDWVRRHELVEAEEARKLGVVVSTIRRYELGERIAPEAFRRRAAAHTRGEVAEDAWPGTRPRPAGNSVP